MEKIGFWGIMLCRGKWFGINCLMGKKERGAGALFLWPFRGGCMPCFWQGQTHGVRLVEKWVGW